MLAMLWWRAKVPLLPSSRKLSRLLLLHGSDGLSWCVSLLRQAAANAAKVDLVTETDRVSKQQPRGHQAGVDSFETAHVCCGRVAESREGHLRADEGGAAGGKDREREGGRPTAAREEGGRAIVAEPLAWPTCLPVVFWQDHRYVGEESAFLEAEGVSGLTEAPTWFIDPLDGTTNFCHGYRNVCVSIGLYVNKVSDGGQ